MPGPPVSMGCVVTLTPGATGAPDTGTIIMVPLPFVTVSGQPVATAGSTCQMINSLTGIPYPIVIPPLGVSSVVKVAGMGIVRMGDRILMGPATLLVVGPPILPPQVTDLSPP